MDQKRRTETEKPTRSQQQNQCQKAKPRKRRIKQKEEKNGNGARINERSNGATGDSGTKAGRTGKAEEIEGQKKNSRFWNCHTVMAVSRWSSCCPKRSTASPNLNPS